MMRSWIWIEIFTVKEEYDMKILFICECNICRSPMAEFIFKDNCVTLYDDGTIEWDFSTHGKFVNEGKI